MTMYEIINYMRACTEFRAKAEFAGAVSRCMRIAKSTDKWTHWQRETLLRQALESLWGMRNMYNAVSENHFDIKEYNKITSLIRKAFYYYDVKGK